MAHDRCDACGTDGCLGCRDHRDDRDDRATMEARTVDSVSVTLCKAAAACIRRAKAAGRWLP